MKDPLVSVVIPCYRQGHLLPISLQSVFDQTYSNVETIVVNDGSDDSTAEVAAGFQPKIHYIEQENRGLSAARNTGIQSSKGDYLLFLDADDAIHPHSIERLVKSLSSSNQMAIMRGADFVHEFPPTLTEPDIPEELQLLPLLIDRNIAPCHAWLCPRLAVLRAGLFCESLRACEDWDLWLRMAIDGVKAIRIPFHGAFYRKYPGSMSTDMNRMLVARTEVLLRGYERLRMVNFRLPQNEVMLWGAARRLRRRWIAVRGDSLRIRTLSRMIEELEGRGIRRQRSWPARIANKLLGRSSEKAIMSYYRWFRPDHFTNYAGGYQ